MEFGITGAKIDEVGVIVHAENLGYDYCWATDSQLIRSNPWAVLALAPTQTRKINWATGLAISGPAARARLAANGIANKQCPGRPAPLFPGHPAPGKYRPCLTKGSGAP